MEHRVMNLPRTRARTGGAAVAAMVFATALLGACRAPFSASSGKADTCATPSAGVTADSIKIGLVYSDTGPTDLVDEFKGVRSAVDARVQLQNAHGGVHGRRIDLVWEDDHSEAGGFSLAAHDLVDTQQAFGLIALTVQLDASAGWLESASVPVTGFATSAAWSDHPNLFQFGNLFDKGVVSLFGDYVNAQGGSRAVIAVDPSSAVYENLANAYAASLRSRGIKVVGRVAYTPGVTSLTALASRLKGMGADTLIGTVQPSDFVDIYAAARQAGVSFDVALNTLGYSADLLSKRGPAMSGMSLISSFAPSDSPPMRVYNDAMSRYAPEFADTSNEVAVASYIAADEMIQGLDLAGPCPTRAAFIRDLRQVRSFTGGGLLAPVDLSSPGTPILCEYFVKVNATGGGFTEVPPPASLNHGGAWCGERLPNQ
jgi:ABC-type branched-subunit amino acid transport system substrate-binding protein